MSTHVRSTIHSITCLPNKPTINRYLQAEFNRSLLLYGPRPEKTCLRGFADQPAHPRSMIRAFVISFWESNIFNLATGKFSIFYLVSVAEKTGLKLALTETQKTGFLEMWPI